MDNQLIKKKQKNQENMDNQFIKRKQKKYQHKTLYKLYMIGEPREKLKKKILYINRNWNETYLETEALGNNLKSTFL